MAPAQYTNLRRERFFRLAPLFVWIGVILFLSTGSGSMSRTSIFVRPLLEFLFPAAGEDLLQFYHGLVRKAAHVFEYAVLGILAFRALMAGRHGALRLYLSSILIVAGVAAVDELNQSRNAARTGSGADVLLDVAGGTLGLACVFVYTKLAGRGRDRHLTNAQRRG